MILKRLLFGLASVLLFFGLIEILLLVLGVRTLLAERDPFRGFAEGAGVYELADDRPVYRTDARALVHSFNYQEFSAPKSREGFRIFSLGGSSTFGFPWGADVAFPRLLGDALGASWPDRQVESINSGAMSYGTHRLRILVRELLEYEPDVLIVYSGHNEFVEERFYRDVLGRRTGLDPAKRMLYRWRLYSVLIRARERARSAATAPTPGERSTGELIGLDVVREETVGVGETEVARVLARLEENLRALIDAGAEAGVPIVLCTVPSNVEGWAPNGSSFGSGVSPEDRRVVERQLRAARTSLEGNQVEAAVRELESARDLAPGHAEVHYRLGQAYQALERWKDARNSFERARDTDSQPARAIGPINETIRRVAASSGAILVDVERRLGEHTTHGLLGFNLFEDYVHPKPRGHQLIALEIWRIFQERGLVGETGPADPAAFWSALGEPGPPDLETVQDAPVAEAGTANPQLLFNLGVVLENQGRFGDAIRAYRDCLELDSAHYVSRVNLGRLLKRTGHPAEAAEEYRAALPSITDDADRARALVGLGEAVRDLGRIGDATDLFDQASRADPGSASAWRNLGDAHARQNRHADAEAAFRRAVALDPDDVEVQANLGFALLFQNRLDEAEQVFRDASETAPEYRRSWNGLAAILTERGAYDEAERLFRESLRLDPSDEFARGGLSVVAKRKGPR